MGLRDRVKDRVDERRGHKETGASSSVASSSYKAEGGQRYRMRERMIAIGDDYWVENEAGERVFYIDGKALRVRETLLFKDAQMNDLYRLQEKMVRIRDTMDIEDPEGSPGYNGYRRSRGKNSRIN